VIYNTDVDKNGGYTNGWNYKMDDWSSSHQNLPNPHPPLRKPIHQSRLAIFVLDPVGNHAFTSRMVEVGLPAVLADEVDFPFY
jgi:hypothetical protein